MTVILQSFIKRSDLKSNPNVKYLFGDNLARKGLGGQAKEMRNEPNAIGIATKKFPSLDEKSFFTDNEYEDNIAQIKLDLEPAFNHLENGGILVIPQDGLGTGLSKLKEKAPKTNAFLEDQINKLINLKKNKTPRIPPLNFKGSFPKKILY